MPRSKIFVPSPGNSGFDQRKYVDAAREQSKRKPVVVPDPEIETPSTQPSRVRRKYVISADTAGSSRRKERDVVSSTTSRPPTRGTTRRRRRRIFVVLVTILTVILAYYGIVAVRTHNAMKHTSPDVLTALSSDPGPTNILMIGSDTRAGGNSIVPGESKAGLADVMMIVQVRGGTARILSIPRDLRVKLPGFGDQKINASMPLGGPAMAVNAVKQITGLPIHRFAVIDFEGFVGVTDSVGGVELCLEHAQRDPMSGLNLNAGCQLVAGDQALAYVRSRHAQILVDGVWTTDGTGDIGRIQRQQKFLGALVHKLSSPVTMTIGAWNTGPALASAFTVDPRFSMFEAAKFLRILLGGSESMELLALPTVPASAGGVAYLELKQPDAQQVIGNFKSR